jgi:hypothetical protein
VLSGNFSFDDSLDALKTVHTVNRLPSPLPNSVLVADEVEAPASLSQNSSAASSSAHLSEACPALNASPSKSIMKKATQVSPVKKSVVFTLVDPQIHRYKKDETEDESHLQALPMEHQWHLVATDGVLDDEDDLPPPPPPHSTNSFAYEPIDEQFDSQKLNEFKLYHKSSSNLSLNEKMDIYVARTNASDGTEPPATMLDSLDAHLNDLESSRAGQTDANIHNLSLDLRTHEVKEIENPLNSLSRSGDVELNSGNTSRSSMQSLKDEERVLPSSSVGTVSRSIELNDGIKGFSDHMVETLIPLETLASSMQRRLPEIGQLDRHMEDSSTEEFHDSFDQSYNHTEQSIMDLLQKQQPRIPSHYIKQEPLEPAIKSEDVDTGITLKIEGDGVQPIKDKHEAVVAANDISASDDHRHSHDISILPNLKSDLEHIQNHHMEISSVSGFGENKEVKLVNANLATTRKSDDSYGSVDESANQFSIREHIDSGWKFEDSNDGDREDNDDYTNDVTQDTVLTKEALLKVHQEEEEQVVTGGKESIEGEPAQAQSYTNDSHQLLESLPVESKLLEVDLSPNVSGEIQHEDSVKSLAPPKIESPIKYPIKSIISSNPATPMNGSPKKSLLESRPSVTEPHFEPRSLFKDFERSRLPEPSLKFRVPLSPAADMDVADEALANSSNIAYNEDITLPPLEHASSSLGGAMKSFHELSFEESLSAEYDKETTSPTNFLSIWHSQDKNKHLRGSNQPTAYDVSQRNLQLPASLQPKRFKEVNVITRRIVSPDHEDFNVSGFLPELSEDSGFGNQFRGIVKSRDSTNTGTTSESESSGIGRDILRDERLAALASDSDSSAPQLRLRPERRLTTTANFKPVQVKRSQFKVPSFEVRRTNSILAPKSQYNHDIFADTLGSRLTLQSEKRPTEPQLGQPATIVSSGMKTLPSMDRDDVQRLLNTKRLVSQEERLKLIGTTKKEALIEPSDKYDELQQVASIHHAQEDDYDDYDITPATSNSKAQGSILPHLADEMMQAPHVLLTDELYFKESEFASPIRDATAISSEDLSRVDSVIHKPTLQPKPKTTLQLFPEPDPELLHDIFKTPPKELDNPHVSADDEQVRQRLLNYDDSRRAHNISFRAKQPTTPVKKRNGKQASPIKIGSPVRIIRTHNGTIAVIQSPKRANKTIDLDPLTLLASRHVAQKLLDSLGYAPYVHREGSSSASAQASQRDTSRQLLDITKSTHKPLFERGRLFLRVVGLKNIDLPDLGKQNAEFTVTLDNGVHCIKTPSYKLEGHNVPIGKEFELTVGPESGLEFILTMKATYKKPKGGLKEVRERKVVRSNTKIGKLLGSKEVITTTKFVPVEVKDPWGRKVAQDGSFARCYVDLEQYEGKITGKVGNFDITCFNEWETLDDSSGAPMKCKPYRIGQLEVRMMFVPRTLNLEVLPSSIKSAYEGIYALKKEIEAHMEGYMHQEGGDCEVRKRRYFKLSGTSLIAHSEFSHKTRAKINLAKVVDVIYVDKDNSHSQLNYRNFSDVLLLENSFKIRFGNGEVIDFGAPNHTEKMEWIRLIEKIIQRNKFRVQPWVKIMMECNNIQPASAALQEKYK